MVSKKPCRQEGVVGPFFLPALPFLLAVGRRTSPFLIRGLGFSPLYKGLNLLLLRKCDSVDFSFNMV